MARRSDPERIFHARRAAVRFSLMDTGLDEATAARWCDAWEQEAAGRQISRGADYWIAGEAWIAGQRAARRPV